MALLFYNNRESKQKFHGTMVKFLTFIWTGSHFRILLRTQNLQPPYTHNKQRLQESQAQWVAIQMKGTEQYFPWYCLLCERRWFHILSWDVWPLKWKLLSSTLKITCGFEEIEGNFLINFFHVRQELVGNIGSFEKSRARKMGGLN